MNNYLFEIITESSPSCGEQFFVQANTRAEANEVLDDFFCYESTKYLGKYSDFEAEMMGLDTY